MRSTDPDENSERGRKPDDNPFINFRRFADAHVSSLLNAVLGLPSSIIATNTSERQRSHFDSWNHQKHLPDQDNGREGPKYDNQGESGDNNDNDDDDYELEQWLREVDASEERLRWAMREGRRVEGKNDWVAEMLRDVFEGGEEVNEAKGEEKNENEKCQRKQVEWVDDIEEVKRTMGFGDERCDGKAGKGKRWDWHWNWSYPPYQHKAEDNDNDEGNHKNHRCRWRGRRHEDAEHDAEESRVAKWYKDWEPRPGHQWCELRRRMEQEDTNNETAKPKVRTWHWSWSYPPQSSPETPQQDRSNSTPDSNPEEPPTPSVRDLHKLFDEADKAFGNFFGISFSHPTVFPDGDTDVSDTVRYLHFSPYSPLNLERNPVLSQSNISWRDAFDDLMRAQQSKPLLPSSEIGKSTRTPHSNWIQGLWTRGTFENERAGGKPSMVKRYFDDEDIRRAYPDFEDDGQGERDIDEHASYEYGHDHEDQHDDPPTPTPDAKNPTFSSPQCTSGVEDLEPATELEAYERLTGPTAFTPPPQAAFTTTKSEAGNLNRNGKPSILSTLTTTERTVQPDGTVTTKMILKKRFADGREESSETVHTQRGHDGKMGGESGEKVWKEMQKARFIESANAGEGSVNGNVEMGEEKKKSGWFWSSR
ncbi:hypothetical protein K432DRAFT_379813 [Lepidopterella palustris CBS 459.81]|uniref:Uncharacterized protein n=1 Tax=Lepidopterella palustris CBS 459.81 TaxID=1314670 RepID=A0A8E2EFZ1_9PEZI|nr:hypothetical protein K432DRAFT_379813 [Lepidopterella palustris CBS 459.81]